MKATATAITIESFIPPANAYSVLTIFIFVSGFVAWRLVENSSWFFPIVASLLGLFGWTSKYLAAQGTAAATTEQLTTLIVAGSILGFGSVKTIDKARPLRETLQVVDSAVVPQSNPKPATASKATPAPVSAILVESYRHETGTVIYLRLDRGEVQYFICDKDGNRADKGKVLPQRVADAGVAPDAGSDRSELKSIDGFVVATLTRRSGTDLEMSFRAETYRNGLYKKLEGAPPCAGTWVTPPAPPPTPLPE